jgi:hypothetical protein
LSVKSNHAAIDGEDHLHHNRDWKRAPARANVAENRGFFQRPQETAFARDWVVADAVLIEPVLPPQIPC